MSQKNSDSAALRSVVWIAAIAVLVMCSATAYHMWDTLIVLYSNNEWLQALTVSSFLGAMAYSLREAYSTLQSKMVDAYFCSISIESKDEHFESVLNFLSQHCKIHSGSMMAQTKKKKKRTWQEWREEALMGIRKPPQMEFRPRNDNDAHVVRYQGRRILLTRTKGDTVTVGWNRKPVQLETLTLSMWGKDNSILRDLFYEAVNTTYKEDSSQINIFVQSTDFWGGWEKALSKTPRPADSVILDETLAEQLLADAREFLGSAEWYGATGIPYRRGYLLYGPPGCGKTSSAEVLAGELKLDIAMLSLSNKEMDDTKLTSALREAPKRCIILLEDVDAVFVERNVARSDGAAPTSGVTFSGLLNAIDGVASQEGRIFFMTTNHIEKLDAALIRPGRCDVKVELRKASRVQMQRLFLRFFPGKDAQAQEFASRLPEFEISMAQLQGHMLESKYSPEAALSNVARLLVTPPDVEKVPIFDHLRRVGLEHLTPYFEHYGYNWRSELSGLSMDQVGKWELELKHLPSTERKTLSAFLEEKPEIMKDYQLANLSQIRDMFLITYAPNRNRDSDHDELEDCGSTDFCRSGSSGFVRMGSDDFEHDTLRRKQAKEFSDLVTKNGKGLVSVFQLKWHFGMFAHSAEEAIANVHLMTCPRKEATWVPVDVPWTSTVSVFSRLGFDAVLPRLVEKQFEHMTDMLHMSKEEVDEELSLSKRESAIYQAILEGDEKRQDVLLSFQRVDYHRVMSEVELYTGCSVDEARRFAKEVCNPMGKCSVSLGQLKRYLDAHKNDLAAVTKNVDKLMSPEIVPTDMKAKNTGDTWIGQFLAGLGLEKYTQQFIDLDICTEDELMTPDPFAEFDDIGMKKLGPKRRLQRAIKQIEERRTKEKEEREKKEQKNH
eukprot:TRINITY_DN94458_c0_g1_i1.p1 TRINITY_DN94458_c0_g1~~TRINITY_DN94458_c0_g1_i1.p1  ORF type:complete len:891 (+),score=90.03 TRINITY_DN94458_c0_g1_i1:111-2783(+)